MLVVIFAEKVALQEASRRAFPHIYEEIALQEASRRAFPHIYEENLPIPAGDAFSQHRIAGTESCSLLRSFDYSGRRFSHVGPGRQAPPPTELTKVSPG